jgi:branched-subunit amino acid transport protein
MTRTARLPSLFLSALMFVPAAFVTAMQAAQIVA